MSFWQGYNPAPQPDVPLAPLTTWRIGGRAQWFAEPRGAGELARLLAGARERGLRPYILGGGSNLLVGDGQLSGIVIRIGKGFANLDADPEAGIIRAGAGVPLAKVLAHAEEHGLSGLETLAGIPGTVGGAVMMNAGSAKLGIGQFVEEVGVVDSCGRFDRYSRGQLFFSYRRSNLENLIITGVILRLGKDSLKSIRKRKAAALERKRKTQPRQQPSAGCVFKNPAGKSAGQLIAEAGCQGLACGGAVVSDLHANFFLNSGGASCEDMLELIGTVRDAVERKFGILLELEVKLWL